MPDGRPCSVTKYANKADEEFLLMLQQHVDSPIIAECLFRLTQLTGREDEREQRSIPCPVCEAPLEVEFDPTQSAPSLRLTLEIDG